MNIRLHFAHLCSFFRHTDLCFFQPLFFKTFFTFHIVIGNISSITYILMHFSYISIINSLVTFYTFTLFTFLYMVVIGIPTQEVLQTYSALLRNMFIHCMCITLLSISENFCAFKTGMSPTTCFYMTSVIIASRESNISFFTFK